MALHLCWPKKDVRTILDKCVFTCIKYWQMFKIIQWKLQQTYYLIDYFILSYIIEKLCTYSMVGSSTNYRYYSIETVYGCNIRIIHIYHIIFINDKLSYLSNINCASSLHSILFNISCNMHFLLLIFFWFKIQIINERPWVESGRTNE